MTQGRSDGWMPHPPVRLLRLLRSSAQKLCLRAQAPRRVTGPHARRQVARHICELQAPPGTNPTRASCPPHADVSSFFFPPFPHDRMSSRSHRAAHPLCSRVVSSCKICLAGCGARFAPLDADARWACTQSLTLASARAVDSPCRVEMAGRLAHKGSRQCAC